MFQQMKKNSLKSWMGCVLLVSSAFGVMSLDAADLHAIIVADTNDSTIGNSTEIDFENMRNEMRRISLYTGLNLKETTIRGKETFPKKVIAKINNLKINKNDVVIFYFSGHGYRTDSKEESPWPYLYFSQANKGIDYDLIGKKLEAYHPRLLIVFADACNSLISDDDAPPLVKETMMGPVSRELLKSNYRKLFMDVEGVIMVTSSKAGESSWGTPEGGLFTLAFLHNLGKSVKSSSEPSWYLILDKASIQVKKHQHPDFRIHLN